MVFEAALAAAKRCRRIGIRLDHHDPGGALMAMLQ